MEGLAGDIDVEDEAGDDELSVKSEVAAGDSLGEVSWSFIGAFIMNIELGSFGTGGKA